MTQLPAPTEKNTADVTVDVAIDFGERVTTVHAAIEKPSKASPMALVAIVDLFAPASTANNDLLDTLRSALLAHRCATLSWEPACEHLIGVDYDRYLARHGAMEVQAVIDAGIAAFAQQHGTLPMHIVAIGQGGMFTSPTAAMRDASSITLLHPAMPRDIATIAEHIDQPLPIGLVETASELDPIADLGAANLPPVLIIADAANPHAPLGNAWALQAAASTSQGSARLLSIARGGADNPRSQSANTFIAARASEFITQHMAPVAVSEPAS